MDWIYLLQDSFTINNTEFPSTEPAASIGVLFKRKIKGINKASSGHSSRCITADLSLQD
jgi:hypothetical protein